MPQKEIQREKITIDAKDKSLGRLASEIAVLLRGKHKPSWTPNIDGGDYVNVVNVDQLKVTGKKASDKAYYWHSEYPGGIKSATFSERVAKHGYSSVLLDAVYNMLPNNKLRKPMMKRLTFNQNNQK